MLAAGRPSEQWAFGPIWQPQACADAGSYGPLPRAPDMSPLTFGVIVFACVLGGGLLGIFLRAVLPERHLSSESKDLVRLTMGLLATMSALVVGLLITTAKTAYDTQGGEFRRMSAEIVLLDRLLAHYGPEAQGAREHL